MVGQYGARLAVKLITDHFGELVGRVCECLVRRGTLSLQEVARYTELGLNQVKNCLRVLIQHNCVQAFSIPKSGGDDSQMKTVTQYMVLFDNIIHRMRFAKFMAIVSAELGPQCETLLLGLLENGRLTLKQLLQREDSRSSRGHVINEEAARANFNRLINARYVERCPRSEPFIAPPLDDSTVSTRRRGPKSADVVLTVEQQATAFAALPEAERFTAFFENGTNTLLDAKAIDHSRSVSVGEKRKHDDLETDKDIMNEVLWRANFEKFVLCLKKKACVRNVQSRLCPEAGIVLEAMIESGSRDKNTVRSSLESIVERVREKPTGLSMTMEHVRAILEELGCHLITEDIQPLYRIDLSKIIELSKNEELEALVFKKYGKDAYRIFRLLTKEKKPIETRKISEDTFLEKKETQAILYKLWADNFVVMEEKATIVGGGVTEYFFWKADKDAIFEHILNDMYHAALNLTLRIAYVVEQDREVSGDEAKRSKSKRAMKILESSLLKLDDAIMLFHDFC